MWWIVYIIQPRKQQPKYVVGWATVLGFGFIYLFIVKRRGEKAPLNFAMGVRCAPTTATRSMILGRGA